jgi:hypothetical protein
VNDETVGTAPSPDVETVLARVVDLANAQIDAIAALRGASPDVETVLEPEYIIVQSGLDGAAWLGEMIDGEPSPIGKVSDLLAAALRGAGLPEPSGGVTVTEWGSPEAEMEATP